MYRYHPYRHRVYQYAIPAHPMLTPCPSRSPHAHSCPSRSPHAHYVSISLTPCSLRVTHAHSASLLLTPCLHTVPALVDQKRICGRPARRVNPPGPLQLSQVCQPWRSLLLSSKVYWAAARTAFLSQHPGFTEYPHRPDESSADWFRRLSTVEVARPFATFMRGGIPCGRDIWYFSLREQRPRHLLECAVCRGDRRLYVPVPARVELMRLPTDPPRSCGGIVTDLGQLERLLGPEDAAVITTDPVVITAVAAGEIMVLVCDQPVRLSHSYGPTVGSRVHVVSTGSGRVAALLEHEPSQLLWYRNPSEDDVKTPRFIRIE